MLHTAILPATPAAPPPKPHQPAAPTQHDPSEYGATIGPDGRHSGGPFQVSVSPKIRIEELRCILRVRQPKR